MTNTPLVSVVIPTYNQSSYLRECIDSVLSQTYTNIEIVVVDDGSTDDTPQILQSYGKKIIHHRQANQGAATALNNGIKMANGHLIAWLSSDDVYLPEKISQQVSFFESNPLTAICYTDWHAINTVGDITQTVSSPFYEPSIFVSKMIWGNFINGTSILMKKNAWSSVGGFDTTLVAAVDGEMWFRLLKEKYIFGHVPVVLVKYRTHPKNQSSNSLLMREDSDRVITKILGWFSYEDLSGINSSGNSTPSEKYQFYITYSTYLLKNFFFSAAYITSRKAFTNRKSLRASLYVFVSFLFKGKNNLKFLFSLKKFVLRLRNKD